MSRIEKLRKEVFLKSSFSDYYYYLFYKEYDRMLLCRKRIDMWRHFILHFLISHLQFPKVS